MLTNINTIKMFAVASTSGSVNTTGDAEYATRLQVDEACRASSEADTRVELRYMGTHAFGKICMATCLAHGNDPGYALMAGLLTHGDKFECYTITRVALDEFECYTSDGEIVTLSEEHLRDPSFMFAISFRKFRDALCGIFTKVYEESGKWMRLTCFLTSSKEASNEELRKAHHITIEPTKRPAYDSIVYDTAVLISGCTPKTPGSTGAKFIHNLYTGPESVWHLVVRTAANATGAHVHPREQESRALTAATTRSIQTESEESEEADIAAAMCSSIVTVEEEEEEAERRNIMMATRASLQDPYRSSPTDFEEMQRRSSEEIQKRQELQKRRVSSRRDIAMEIAMANGYAALRAANALGF